MNHIKACVLGSTGLIGGHLIDLLCKDSDYTNISSLSRTLPSIDHPKLKLVKADLSNLESHISEFEVDTVFCAIGTTIKKAGSREKFREVDYNYVYNSGLAAKKAGAKRFSLVTALGSDANSLIFYNKVKGEIEKDLIGLNLNSLSIFRPSLLLGERQESRSGEKVGELIMGVISFALVGPLKRYKAIEAKKVAQGMIIDSKQSRTGLKIYESNEIEELDL